MWQVQDLATAAYLSPLLAIWVGHYAHRRRRDRANRAALEAARGAGLTEPASLHPVIDPALCLGSGACVRACPEGDVLGLIDGKAQLINPSRCIGHGACRDACHMGAISLVFGTERRGVDIPHLTPGFETNVPGLFIAGELGGMGLIRNALEQGRQAVETIARLGGIGRGDRLDLVIVGAGPAGIAASLAATEKRLRFATLEQESLGGTVAHFPRGKLVMTAPARLPIVGKVPFTEVSKEELLAFWRKVERDVGLTFNYNERVDAVVTEGDGFVVRTPQGEYRTRAVLLAIGRRGTPRKLDVAGEELSKVVYRLSDPGQYRGQRVLVVGGGDSALEAAASVADEAGTTVTLSYRSAGFSRAKENNRRRIDAAVAAGRLTLLLESNVTAIEPGRVLLEQRGTPIALDNDAVIVSAGGVLPTPFLRRIGVEVETKYGTV